MAFGADATVYQVPCKDFPESIIVIRNHLVYNKKKKPLWAALQHRDGIYAQEEE